MVAKTTLGKSGRAVGRIGLGTMGMSFGYDPHGRDDARSIAVIRSAIELGANLIDTADVYGPFNNEELVGQAIRGHRDAVVLSTKGGLLVKDYNFETNGKPDYLRQAVDASLKRLGVDHIDLYFLHRVDPDVPLEESWGALAEIVEGGKLGALGLSAVALDEIKRAEAVHPVAAVQSELSLFDRTVLADVLPYTVENGIAFLPFSPLGRGILTGTFGGQTDVPKDDWRLTLPQFSENGLAAYRESVETVRKIAREHGATPGQVALAWLLSKGEYVIPIPGTKTPRYLEENTAATELRLTANDIANLDALELPTRDRVG
ncbi:aldo/keto reductase [Chelativorans sp. YIM 93263]|uniref:aldo/keto reductase n=1 Tax=Chelativorans sp. YIM 93263 TaxID=2906648 RepID=UPI00237A03B7|nr:aldo/keto reductase [Chelativorans sp. YIM 93263]